MDKKGLSSDGYTIYYYYPMFNFENYIILFDMRDDINSPTIKQGDSIYAYMIFEGVQTLDGIDYACFDLISVDK